ncbi:sulfatase [Paenibacillus sp. MBLB4367]|uniref:sulfatase n=1 Tax=Paenibacillus sp. MBLB4367 TaxID=3384767 RepID=UPI0039082C56
MRAIMVMFDSLNRHMLPPYGCEDIHAPHFARLARKTVTFDNSYSASLPCMPARRELHTGRYNFLHRSWGPLEPFDDSMPQLLQNAGVYTHLISDHYHYWEDGGATYHNRYNSWEIVRGQEGDPWKGEVLDPAYPVQAIGVNANTHVKHVRQDWINRKHTQKPGSHPQLKTFELGLDFIRCNHKEDQWFLQVETFDPHEPFHSPEPYKRYYEHDYDGPHFDWPAYRKVQETSEQAEHCKLEYSALVTMCDEQLGKVLDLMDEYDLWEDTMLIVNTDHGFLLGEHDWWGKVVQPFYNEVVHTPLFIWDPRSKRAGVRCDCLVQTIDLAPTLLDFFGLDIPGDMQGKSLKEAVADNKTVREACLFGVFGGHVNCTDGRYVYMRQPAQPFNEDLYEYTLMPTHMKAPFRTDELRSAKLVSPLSFTKGCPVLKVKSGGFVPRTGYEHLFTGNLLFDLQDDPGQANPLQNRALEERMIAILIRLMRESDAPEEQFARLGL